MQASVNDGVTVLLIEDDADISDMYRIRLIADGYSVLIASTGEDGIRLAEETLPDFIYLDLGLPDLHGFHVLDHLLSSPKTQSTPVVILTNYDDPNMRTRGLRLGAVEFMAKSHTTPAQLSMTVRRTTSVAA